MSCCFDVAGDLFDDVVWVVLVCFEFEADGGVIVSLCEDVECSCAFVVFLAFDECESRLDGVKVAIAEPVFECFFFCFTLLFLCCADVAVVIVAFELCEEEVSCEGVECVRNIVKSF